MGYPVWSIGVRRPANFSTELLLRDIADVTGEPIAPCDMGDSVRADKWSAVIDDLSVDNYQIAGFDIFIDVYAPTEAMAAAGAAHIRDALRSTSWEIEFDLPSFGNLELQASA